MGRAPKQQKQQSPEQQKVITLKRITDKQITIPIIGVTPLIPHKWGEKALRHMRATQGIGAPTIGREKKDPQGEAESTLYYMPNGKDIGMPAVAFKAATVGGCRFFPDITMTFAKLCIFVVGEGPSQLVKLTVGGKEMHEDTPRNDNGKPDLRYRYYLWPWSAELIVRYPEKTITEESILALVDAGGRGGIGDWRPSAPKSSTGTYGQFRIED